MACTCDIISLMRNGCTCGEIEAERNPQIDSDKQFERDCKMAEEILEVDLTIDTRYLEGVAEVYAILAIKTGVETKKGDSIDRYEDSMDRAKKLIEDNMKFHELNRHHQFKLLRNWRDYFQGA